MQYKRFCLGVYLIFGLLLETSRAAAHNGITPPPRMAIILDDAGFSTNNMDLLKDLSMPVTVAIIPGTRCAADFAELCRVKPYEMIAHVPMEALPAAKSSPLVRTGMDPMVLQQQLSQALDSLGPITGMNNHKGSKATADVETMRAVMKVLKARNLFILDSCTTRESVIPKIAQEEGVPYLCNDHFLDGRQNVEAIQQRLEELAEIAQDRGYAVGIGHVTRRPMLEALQVFVRNHPELEWVSISTLVNEVSK